MNRWLCVSVVLTAAAWAATLYCWYGLYDRLPDPVPVHWNAAGKADGFVMREDRASLLLYLLLVPGLMVMIIFSGVTCWLR